MIGWCLGGLWSMGGLILPLALSALLFGLMVRAGSGRACGRDI